MVIGVVTAIGFFALGLQTGPVAAAETLSCATAYRRTTHCRQRQATGRNWSVR